MGTSKALLPLKLTATDESLTAQNELVLFGDYLRATGVCGLIDEELPGRTAGHLSSFHALPLVLMLASGGRTLEDLRSLHEDKARRSSLRLEAMPSSDAVGDWLRRMGAGKGKVGGLAGLRRINRRVVRRLMHNDKRTDYTLDIHVAKLEGETGYKAIVGYLSQTGLIIRHEFQEGSAAQTAANLVFLLDCNLNMPTGKKIVDLRADEAAYQAAIINWCEETGTVFAIGADQDAAAKAAIQTIPENAWTKFCDGEIAEAAHCLDKTNKAFRLIVTRHPQEKALFEYTPPYHYHAIACNHPDEDVAATMEWYFGRSDTHENRIKDLKSGFGIKELPSGSLEANAMFFSIGAMTYNLYLGFRWERMARIHFLHIGKTGGSAIKAALGSVNYEYGLVLHKHATRLRDVPEDHRVFFFVRDPVSRYVSGFNSRLRGDWPLREVIWSIAEEGAFSRFKTPNQLAEALSDPAQKKAAERAMRTIGHVREHLTYWLESENYLDSRASSILFIGTQDRLSDQFARLRMLLGLPHVELPSDAVAANVTPTGYDTYLSDLGCKNILDWYKEDIALYARMIQRGWLPSDTIMPE